MLEVEKRYRVKDTTEIANLLIRRGNVALSHDHIIDEWYAPLSVQSHDQQHEWFDNQHGIAYRIRRIEQPDGTFEVKVETKQLTRDNDHNTFHETELEVADYEEAKALLANKDYWNWLTIDKTRDNFQSDDPDLEIVLDTIKGLADKTGTGAVLEIEYKGNLDRDKALLKIGSYATKLGLSPNDLFDKSLTVEAMTVLAKF